MGYWTTLTALTLDDNNISGLSQLSTLTNLVRLSAENNNITDITPLGSLTNLIDLYLTGNNISDISTLTNISAPWDELYLDSNRIIDISPFLLNTGAVTGAYVDFSDDPLDSYAFSYVIPTLITNGVGVYNDTPYILTYTAGSHGTLSGLQVQYVGPTFNGTAVTAIPNSNYQFSSWSDGSTQNPRTDTAVGSDITVSANFVLTPAMQIGSTMANMIAIVLGAVIIFLLLGYAFIEIKNNGFTEAVGITFMGILGIIILEIIIVAIL
jgi:Leucine-rich repeat (LRR) protein